MQVPPDESLPAGSVLRDTLLLLSCRETKVSVSMGGRGSADQNEDGDAVAGNADGDPSLDVNAAVAAAEKKLSRVVVNMMVPLLLSLKSILQKLHSPFLRYLRIRLNEVMIFYRNSRSSAI